MGEMGTPGRPGQQLGQSLHRRRPRPAKEAQSLGRSAECIRRPRSPTKGQEDAKRKRSTLSVQVGWLVGRSVGRSVG